MKMSKKAIMGISLVIGTMLFTTTAFAEITSNNGYEQFKDALKKSAESCSSKFDNYTMSTSFVIKDGDKLLLQQDGVSKYDNIKYATESSETDTYGGKKTENYYYCDRKGYIRNDGTEGTYTAGNYSVENNDNSMLFRNPFKEESASDMEKIIDAIVGNLKDYVIVNQKSDGSKELSGAISEAQIPAIANALTSYFIKNQFGNGYSGQLYKLPKIKDDVYVKKINGNATVDKNGVIQNVMGTGVISAKDEKGTIHEFTFEILEKLTDINSTTINRPDLTGKNVELSTIYNEGEKDTIKNSEKYIGTYKSDIIIEKDNKFQKIGERFIDITKIDDKNVNGRYHEEYIKGYDEYSKNVVDFNFDGNFNDDNNITATFKSEDKNNGYRSGNISIQPRSSKIYFSIDKINDSNIIDDGEYSRVFN